MGMSLAEIARNANRAVSTICEGVAKHERTLSGS
jgi:hypothetical protein